MALEIVWTKQAAKGYAQILEYLDIHFTEREIKSFEKEMVDFFENLKEHPEIIRAKSTGKRKNIRRGPINRHTMITYQIKPRKNQIQLLNIRASRQKPM